MNNFDDWFYHKDCDLNPDVLAHGLRPLHTLIGTVENLMNLSSMQFMDNSKSQARGDDKLEKDQRYRDLQKQLEIEFNLRVGYVRSEGGTTLDGNVARALFQQPVKFARVLKIDEELVYILSLLLIAIRSSYDVILEEYERLANRAMEIFRTKYPNFRPSPKVHLMLVHGKEILSQMILPPSYYSEEGPEANNKHLRIDRDKHARHDSREHNMNDVYKNALVRSDEKVTKIGLARRQMMKKEEEMTPDLKKLLKFVEQE